MGMSTYCISDIHGHFDEFFELLGKIALCDDDELIVAGDIIDRGSKSAEMLIWAVDEAPANISFLLGNHESMLLQALRKQPEWLQISRSNHWNRNGGSSTRRHIKKLTDGEWRRYVLHPWVEALPKHRFVEAGGRRFLLVHAGVNPARIGEITGKRPFEESVDIGEGFGTQSVEDLAWIREEWYLDPTRMPCDVVHGHSMFDDGMIADITAAAPHLPFSGCVGRICHYFGNRHNIDCGGSAGKPPHALGCLKLDNMEETYIEF